MNRRIRGISLPSPKTDSRRVTGDPELQLALRREHRGQQRQRPFAHRQPHGGDGVHDGRDRGRPVRPPSPAGPARWAPRSPAPRSASRSGAAAASLTAFSAIRRAISGVVQGVSNDGSRKAAGRQCTVTVTGRPNFRADPHPGRGERRPDAGVHVHQRRNCRAAAPSRSAGTGIGLLAISAGIGMPKRCTGTGNFRPAIRRGSGVAVITSGSRPILLLPPGQVVDLHLDPAEPGHEAVGDVRDPHRPTRLPTSRPGSAIRTLRHASPVPHTVVFFHAHPDDEALLTSGTMAKLAAQGHRVVLVVATAGEAGLAADELTADGGLGDRGWPNCDASADGARGAAGWRCWVTPIRVWPGDRPPTPPPGRLPRFVDADVDAVAGTAGRDPGRRNGRRADQLRRQRRLRAPGPHRGAPRSARAAAELAGTPVAAGGDRAAGSAAGRGPRGEPAAAARRAGRPGAVGARLLERPRRSPTASTSAARPGQRRASMRAHASQATADRGPRTLGIFTRIPPPLFGWVFGREWYRQPGVARSPALTGSDTL